VNQLSDLIKLTPDHTLRLSFEHRYNRDIVWDGSVEQGTISYHVLSPSVMWDWAMADDLSLTSAVRLDHLMLNRTGGFPANMPQTNAQWNRDIDAISYNSGLVWRASDQDTVRVSTARGIQLPSLIEFGAFIGDLSGFGIPAFVTGNPALDPTVVTNYEL